MGCASCTLLFPKYGSTTPYLCLAGRVLSGYLGVSQKSFFSISFTACYCWTVWCEIRANLNALTFLNGQWASEQFCKYIHLCLSSQKKSIISITIELFWHGRNNTTNKLSSLFKTIDLRFRNGKRDTLDSFMTRDWHVEWFTQQYFRW